MIEGWVWRSLEEIASIKQGKYLGKGEMHSSPTMSFSVPVIGANGVLGYTNSPSYSDPVALVTCRGNGCGLVQWLAEPSWVSNNAMALNGKHGFDNLFIRYMALGTDFSDVTTGSAQPQITVGNLAKKRFLVPPLDEQRRIAGVLGALDDLIEVNRRLIRDLLATVNTDFESRFGQRELSLRLDVMASVIDCLHSKKPDRVTSGHRLLQLSNILDSGQLDIDDMYGITAEDYLRWTKNIETREWDCVITNVGRVGAVARIPAGVAAALGRNMTAIRPKAPEQDGAFILAALLSRPVHREITLKTDSGTVMDALNVKNIPSLRLPEASPGERSEFHAFARPLLLAADALKNEVTQIQATRDELLPLLMSGRVRVADEVAA